MGGFRLPTYTADPDAIKFGGFIDSLKREPMRKIQEQTAQLSLDQMLSEKQFNEELQAAISEAAPGEENKALLRVLQKRKPKEYITLMNSIWDSYAELAKKDPAGAADFLKKNSGLEVSHTERSPGGWTPVYVGEGAERKILGYEHPSKPGELVQPKERKEPSIEEKLKGELTSPQGVTPERKTQITGGLKAFTESTTKAGSPPAVPGIGRTIKKLGADGKPHVFLWNPETQAYDQDQGLATTEGERKPYGARTVVTLFDKAGKPTTYFADPVNQTLTPIPEGEGTARTEARDVPQGTQTVLQSIDLTLPVMEELKRDFAKLETGPLRGRLASFSMKNLGSAGLGAEEIAIRSKLGRLTADQIFGEGGKQLTGTEKEMLSPYMFQQSDSLEALKAKLPELEKRTQRIKVSRMKMLNPRTKAVMEAQGSEARGQTVTITSPGKPPRSFPNLSPDQVERLRSIAKQRGDSFKVN